MLANDPPPGTRVRFLKQVKTVEPRSIGLLVKAVRKYTEDRPWDEFEVSFGGYTFVVRRDDIEKE